MRVALTGGATGIGAGVVDRLLARDHHVTVFDIQAPDSAVQRWIKTDLGDSAAIRAAIEEVDGPFDALINNAGIPPRAGEAERVLRINYFGLATFLEGMRDRLSPGASIVNTASRAGAHWRANLGEVRALMALDVADLPGFIAERGIDATRAYCLSKEAVIAMTLAATQSTLARGVRMNSVSPAAVSTGILPEFAEAFGDRMARNLARSGRAGTAEEIADVIVFLASPESGWIKGQDIVVDGGMSAISLAEELGL
ncbi:SDR family oxidoreductase [Tateyamaria sp. SN3-11]|uniref:SDR family oxidoreductase n=1 Tax=Tateyamaria sp. SN3-11 TaxID=3092147 RepID=UPI0039EB4B99